MPYFERKPFAELQDASEVLRNGAGSVSDLDRSSASNQEALTLVAPIPGSRTAGTAMHGDPPLVQQAAAILRQESQSAPVWSPPVNTLAVPWALTGLSPGVGIAPVVLQVSSRAGEKARISVSIINDSSDDVSYSFAFTDLISPGGERIPYSGIKATPDTAIVPAGRTADAVFEVQVPSVQPGPYFGVATCRETQPAILVLTVSA